MSALKYWLWLTELRGLKNQTRLALLRHFGSPEDVFYADAGEILLTEGITQSDAAILKNHDLKAADRILADCQRLDIRILTIQDAEYPNRLKNIYDPPCLLYVKGRLPAFDETVAVAVVGTRNCTPYGESSAEKLSYGLTGGGAIVVSGLAKGIDAAATRGALRSGGVTVGVVGNGLDVCYPYESRYLFAVPGPIDAPASVGCNRLIRDGAGLVSDAWDILREYEARFPDKLRRSGAKERPKTLGYQARQQTEPKAVPPSLNPADCEISLTDDQIALLRILPDEEPALVDDLIEQSGIPTRRVLSALTVLEIENLVRPHSGKRYTRAVTLID